MFIEIIIIQITQMKKLETPKHNSKSSLSPYQQILRLKAQLQHSFQCLNQENEATIDKKEDFYFRSFMSVMDRITEELIWEQQKYRLMDVEGMLQDKCINICQGIQYYRSQCHRLKSQIKEVKEQLHKEQSRGRNIKEEIKEIQILSEKKHFQASRNKEQYCQQLMMNAVEKKKEKMKKEEKGFAFGKTISINEMIYSKKQTVYNRSKSFREHAPSTPPLYMYPTKRKFSKTFSKNQQVRSSSTID